MCEADCGAEAKGPVGIRTAIGFTVKYVCSTPCANTVVASHWAQPAKRVPLPPIRKV